MALSAARGARWEHGSRESRRLKVAILVDDGFEQVELVEPRKALDEAGVQTRIVSPKSERVRGWNFTDWGDEPPVDLPLDGAKSDDFDALLLPGGVLNPDALRMQPKSGRVRQGFLRRRQAGGVHLQKPLRTSP
jgi:protease I